MGPYRNFPSKNLVIIFFLTRYEVDPYYWDLFQFFSLIFNGRMLELGNINEMKLRCWNVVTLNHLMFHY